MSNTQFTQVMAEMATFKNEMATIKNHLVQIENVALKAMLGQIVPPGGGKTERSSANGAQKHDDNSGNADGEPAGTRQLRNGWWRSPCSEPECNEDAMTNFRPNTKRPIFCDSHFGSSR